MASWETRITIEQYKDDEGNKYYSVFIDGLDVKDKCGLEQSDALDWVLRNFA